MKHALLLLPFLLLGCTVSQKITYPTNNLTTSPTIQTIPAMVEVRIFKDNRTNVVENDILFNNSRQVKLNGTQTCINSEKHYKKDTVVTQITKVLVEHFNKVRLFDMAFYNHSEHSNYYLTGKLNSFYSEQKFSMGAAMGAQFGLIGAIATAGIKTPGTIIIDISDLKLYEMNGTLIKDFGSFYKEYNDDFKADANCWCAYWNANLMLRDFNTMLIEKIRNDMQGVKLK